MSTFDVSVDLPAIEEMMDGIVGNALVKTDAAMLAATKDLIVETLGKWPVSPPWHHSQLGGNNRPHSRDLFELTSNKEGLEVSRGISNSADYFLFIKYASGNNSARRKALARAGVSAAVAAAVTKGSPGKSAAIESLFKPALERADALAATLIREVGE